ncbi:MAG: UDP-N-acetylmuramate dehydrogenase [Anaerolineaceae bacterium]|nr:UDP-N-acetylmuramate dehydrogenase [Anaerolineaceae bacterium]MDD4042406.1 UDP-N-acetylmuramate dehydrogenase [Anaerolineaceae bacterium]
MTNLPLSKLQEIFGERLQENVRMTNYTTTRVGGAVTGMISINSSSEMEFALTNIWELDVPYHILGSGSNLLISDSGYDGIILHNRSHNIRVITKNDPPLVIAESGAGLGQMAQLASRRGVSGFEWANSIPGTVGGAVYGNAGAHGTDVSQILQSALVMTREGGTQLLSNEDMSFEYRSSRFKREHKSIIILEATFVGQKADPEDCMALLHELTEKRKKTQPVGPSFGSTFKNPPGNFAGKLLAEAGMKGVTCGGASFSEKHANFIVNNGGATAQDYYCLIRKGQKRVKEMFDVDLNLEIELLGEFEDVDQA